MLAIPAGSRRFRIDQFYVMGENHFDSLSLLCYVSIIKLVVRSIYCPCWVIASNKLQDTQQIILIHSISRNKEVRFLRLCTIFFLNTHHFREGIHNNVQTTISLIRQLTLQTLTSDMALSENPIFIHFIQHPYKTKMQSLPPPPPNFLKSQLKW